MYNLFINYIYCYKNPHQDQPIGKIPDLDQTATELLLQLNAWPLGYSSYTRFENFY